MNPTDFIKQLKKEGFYEDQLTHIERLKARRAQYASLKRPLRRSLVEAIQAEGTQQLYLHQAQAIDAVRDGQHVVLEVTQLPGRPA